MPAKRTRQNRKPRKLDSRTKKELKRSLRAGYTEMAELNRELAE